jgi:hypothetical protein
VDLWAAVNDLQQRWVDVGPVTTPPDKTAKDGGNGNMYSVDFWRRGDSPDGGEMYGMYSTKAAAEKAAAEVEKWAATIKDPAWQIVKVKIDTLGGPDGKTGATTSGDMGEKSVKKNGKDGPNPNNNSPNTARITDYRGLSNFAQQLGFTVTSTTGGRHNTGSAHYQGRAIDVSVRGKTPAEIDQFIREARNQGIQVRDERTHPPGQRVWHGPHLHLQVPPQPNNTSSPGSGSTPLP